MKGEIEMSEHPIFCPKPKDCELLAMRTKTKEIFERRYNEACAVIDSIAEYLGIYNKGLYTYSLGIDDHSPLIDKLEEWESRSGDKVKLKKRIDELENENMILKNLIRR